MFGKVASRKEEREQMVFWSLRQQVLDGDVGVVPVGFVSTVFKRS